MIDISPTKMVEYSTIPFTYEESQKIIDYYPLTKRQECVNWWLKLFRMKPKYYPKEKTMADVISDELRLAVTKDIDRMIRKDLEMATAGISLTGGGVHEPDECLSFDGLAKLSRKIEKDRIGKVKNVTMFIHPDSQRDFDIACSRWGIHETKPKSSSPFNYGLDGIEVRRDEWVKPGLLKLVTERFNLPDEIQYISLTLPWFQFDGLHKGVKVDRQRITSKSLQHRSNRSD